MQNTENVFFTMVETVIKNKKTAIFVTVAFMVLSWVVAFTLPEKFKGYVEFRIVKLAGTSPPKGIASSLNLPGLSLGQGEDVSENLAILASRNLTSLFIEKYKLLPILFDEKWNKETNSWHLDNIDEEPTVWQATKFFDTKVRAVDFDKETNLIKMTMLWTDPKTAAFWANEYLKFADEYIANLARIEVRDKINFIKLQLNQSLDNDVKQSLIRLLQEELKKNVLLATTKAYVFKVLDPAVVPELKSEPLKGLIILGGSILSILIGIIAALLKESFSVYFQRKT